MSDTTKAKTRKKAAPAEARPPGRPSDYSLELADLICERMAEGESLRSICQADDMPNRATVFRWLASNKEFSDQYARACEARAEFLFDDMLDIADETGFDTLISETGPRANTEWISRSRLRVDTRKWMLAKLVPKRFGDKLAIGGADDLPPIKTMTDEELDAAIAKAAAAAHGGDE